MFIRVFALVKHFAIIVKSEPVHALEKLVDCIFYAQVMEKA